MCQVVQSPSRRHLAIDRNAEVPTDAAGGDAVPLVVSIGGAVSNTVTIAVE